MAKPPPINLEEVMVAALKALKANKGKIGEVADDAARLGGEVAGAGKGLLETITKAVKGEGKVVKPKLPKNPPKSVVRQAMPEDVRFPKSPPKSGRGSKPKLTPEQIVAAKNAKTLENKAAWAIKREEYNALKRAEREARKAKNRSDWAQKLDEKYGGNIVEAAKATSKSPSKANRNKKRDKK